MGNKKEAFIATVLVIGMIFGLIYVGLLGIDNTQGRPIDIIEENVIVESTEIRIKERSIRFYIKCNSTIESDYFKIRYNDLTISKISNGTILRITWEKRSYGNMFPNVYRIEYIRLSITIISTPEVLK